MSEGVDVAGANAYPATASQSLVSKARTLFPSSAVRALLLPGHRRRSYAGRWLTVVSGHFSWWLIPTQRVKRLFGGNEKCQKALDSLVSNGALAMGAFRTYQGSKNLAKKMLRDRGIVPPVRKGAEDLARVDAYERALEFAAQHIQRYGRAVAEQVGLADIVFARFGHARWQVRSLAGYRQAHASQKAAVTAHDA